LGLVLASAFVPSCAHPKDEWISVSVSNQGSAPVDAKLERTLINSGYVEETDLTVPPGGGAVAQLEWPRTYSLRIRVTSSTDQSVIFDETWSGQEIYDLDRRITVTISP
jgi:siroheme synthase (precorrin-2 oxidase/ferrochelatase)